LHPSDFHLLLLAIVREVRSPTLPLLASEVCAGDLKKSGEAPDQEVGLIQKIDAVERVALDGTEAGV
jgi:hypothetical protein